MIEIVEPKLVVLSGRLKANHNPNKLKLITPKLAEKVFPFDYCRICLGDMEVNIPKCFFINCSWNGHLCGRVTFETKSRRIENGKLIRILEMLGMSRTQFAINLKLELDWIFWSGEKAGIHIHHGNQNPFDDRGPNLSVQIPGKHLSPNMHEKGKGALKPQIPNLANQVYRAKNIIRKRLENIIKLDPDGKLVKKFMIPSLFFEFSNDKKLLKEFLKVNNCSEDFDFFNSQYKLWKESKVPLRALIQIAPDVKVVPDDPDALIKLEELRSESIELSNSISNKIMEDSSLKEEFDISDAEWKAIKEN
jgi:hypothetical protein